MFIIETNPTPEGEKLLRRVKKFIGHIPPHFELFATVNPKRFEMFLSEIFYLSMHKSINPDFFAFIRYFIAFKEQFHYCETFNKALLIKKGHDETTLNNFIKNSNTFPLDARHQALFSATLEAVYHPEKFTAKTIETLKELQWHESDIFDAIDHGAFLFKFSKVLKAYSA